MRPPDAFLRDESGLVTVEAVLWMSFLFGMAAMVGQTIVGPLVTNANAQAQMNSASVQIIQDALATCQVSP